MKQGGQGRETRGKDEKKVHRDKKTLGKDFWRVGPIQRDKGRTGQKVPQRLRTS